MGGWNFFHDVFNTGDPFDTTGKDTKAGTGFQQNPNGNSFDLGKALGVVPNYVRNDEPGSNIDTTGADQQRDNMSQLVAALQQQATTGDGDWQKTLAAGTQATQNNASALGQNQNQQGGVGYASALRNIQNAQGASRQQAEGQANTLRAQSQQDAQSQLGALNASMNTSDINQANAQAGARQGVREANVAATGQANDNAGKLKSGLASIAGPFASRGGRVPGRPKVFGNSEKNDVVPAMLSPGEIVVPRTEARDPRAAAAFARAVAMRHGKHLADGGVPDSPDTGTQIGFGVGSMFGLGGAQAAYLNNKLIQDPSIGNGGALDPSQYNSSMAGLVGAANSSMAAAPTVTGQQITDASDNSIAGAMGQQQRASASAASLSQALRAQQAAGAHAAGTRLNEKTTGQRQAGQDLAAARQNALGMATDQQQAAFNSTMINHGLSLANQQALRGTLASMGQGATSLSHFMPSDSGIRMTGGGGDEPGSGVMQGDGGGDQTPPDLGGGGDEPGSGVMQGDGGSSGDGMAYGGAAYARGGTISDAFMSGGLIPSYGDGGRVVHTGAVDNHRFENQLRADYDAEQAKRAIAKGPDLNYQLSHVLKGDAGYEPHTGQVKAENAANQLRSDYDAEQARRAVANGPDLNHRLSQLLSDRGQPERVASRAHGGSIPGYSGGTPNGVPDLATYSIQDPLPDRSAIPPPQGQAPVSGAQLGLGGGWSNDARVAMPQLDTSGAPTNFPPPTEKLEKTLVPTGATKDGRPVVEERDVVMQNALPAGLRPKEQPAAPAAALVAHQVAPSEKLPDTSSFDRADIAQQSLAKIASDKAGAEANALATQREVLQSRQKDQERRLALAQEQGSQMMARQQAMVDEMKKVDASVDPGRYWATRSTGQKILNIIGLALGSFSPDGVNRAAQMTGQAIDRDIDAQKAEYAARIGKGEAGIRGLTSAYAMNRQLFQDELAATAATKATMLELADNQNQTIAATYASPQAKANAQMLSAQNQQARQKYVQEAQTHAVDNNYKRAETAKAYAEAGADGRKGGINPAEAKDLHAAEATAQDSLDLIRTIRGSLQRAQSSVPGVTAIKENLGEEAPALGTASTQLTLKLKDMAKLGQISATDQALLDKLLGDPQAIVGRGSSEAAKQSRLTALEGIVTRSIQNQRRAAQGFQAQ